MNRLLLIGTGDLPTRLVRTLRPARWDIVGIRRRRRDVPGVSMTFGDATDPEALRPLLATGPDVALVTVTPDGRDAPAYEATYLGAARAVAAVARAESPTTHLVFVSSTSVYAQDAGEDVTEASETRPTRPTARVLLDAERAIAGAGSPWSVVRFSGIYGPGRERLVRKVEARDFTPPDRLAWTNRIHADDCAGVLRHLVERENTRRDGAGILLASDSRPALNVDVEQWIADRIRVGGATAPTGFEGADAIPPHAAPRAARGKRCRNTALIESGYSMLYPDYRAGYAELLRDR